MISKTTLFATFFIFAAFLEALPSGAPLSACQTMLPHHNAKPIDTENPPYEIVYSIVNNSTLKVTLQSKDEEKAFRGFLMQARREWNSEAVGKWSTKEPNTKTIDCFDLEDSAVTHDHKQNSLSRKNGFKKLTFEWNCPEKISLNGLILIATIAETSKVIYVNISNVVHVETPKVESISFDDFSEGAGEFGRDQFDSEKVSKKIPDSSPTEKLEMDLERKGQVDLDALEDVQNKVVKQSMARVNEFDEEEEKNSVNESQRKLINGNGFIGLEEPIQSKTPTWKQRIMNDEEIGNSEMKNMEKFQPVNKKKLMPKRPIQQKETVSLDENQTSSIMEKNDESEPVNDKNRKLVSAKDLFEDKSENQDVKQESMLDDDKKEEIKRLQAQIKVLQLKLKKIIDNN